MPRYWISVMHIFRIFYKVGKKKSLIQIDSYRWCHHIVLTYSCYLASQQHTLNFFINCFWPRVFTSTDNNINWPSEDSSTPTPGASGSEAWPVFRIWCCCSNALNVHICPDCSLAGLHLVCDWECRKALPDWQNRMVGFLRTTDWKTLQWQWLEFWAIH